DLPLGDLDPLADGDGHLFRLAGAVAHAAVAVPDHHQGGEGEVLASLHHLGHAVDVHDLLEKFALALEVPGQALLLRFSLKLQTFFAGALGQRLDTAVVDVAAAVEDHLLDPALLGARRHQLAHQLRRRLARGRGTDLLTHRGVGGARLGQRHALVVVDQLRVDETQALVDRQTRPLGAAPHPLAKPQMGPLAARLLRLHTLGDVVAHIPVPLLRRNYLPPALPTLRRRISVVYLMPLPL